MQPQDTAKIVCCIIKYLQKVLTLGVFHDTENATHTNVMAFFTLINLF